VIKRRIQELWETEPQTGFIIAGDLNLNYDEFYRRDSGVIVSLLPDSPRSAELAGSIDGEQNDFLVISGNKPPLPIYFPQETVVLFSPWFDELENGSYFFRNNWETIDHFLVSHHFFDNTGYEPLKRRWEYERTVVVDFEPFTRSNGQPNPYNPRTGHGLSDHLPLILTLTTNN
jgi:hypothetical protein